MRSRWLAILAGAMTGCSLLYAPSSDLTNGGGGSGDAGNGPETAASQDGPSSVDAAADASVEASALTCPSGALLCEDFEHDSVIGPFVTATGPLTITGTRAHSPTRSLSAIARKDSASPNLEATLAVPAKATISFWLYAATPPPDAVTNFRVAHFLWGAACDWELSVTVYLNATDGLKLSADAYDKTVNPSCGPVANDIRTLLTASDMFVPSWHHIVATMDVSQQARRVEPFVDGKVVNPATASSNRFTVPTKALVAVGIPCVNSNAGCFDWMGTDYEVMIDDVVVTAL